MIIRTNISETLGDVTTLRQPGST